MTPPDLPPIEGATPLDAEALAGLKISSILTQADLNAAEEANILGGMRWASRTRRADLLSRAYALALHERMFGDVWSWAGMWRRRETNIGVDPVTIPTALEALLNDVLYWLGNATYSRDEIAIRLHHRMVAIHPFANGNGRHSRLMADLLIVQSGAARFSWGGRSLSDASDVRRRYIHCLRLADGHDIGPLLAFARS